MLPSYREDDNERFSRRHGGVDGKCRCLGHRRRCLTLVDASFGLVSPVATALGPVSSLFEVMARRHSSSRSPCSLIVMDAGAWSGSRCDQRESRSPCSDGPYASTSVPLVVNHCSREILILYGVEFLPRYGKQRRGWALGSAKAKSERDHVLISPPLSCIECSPAISAILYWRQGFGSFCWKDCMHSLSDWQIRMC